MVMKGIAISQIILLVLGIIVLGVVAFLLISNFTTTTGQIDIQKCRSAAINACTTCSIANGGNAINCAAATYLTSINDRLCAPLIGVTNSPKLNKEGKTIDYEVSGLIPCDQFIGGRSSGECTFGTEGGECTKTDGKAGTWFCQEDRKFKCI